MTALETISTHLEKLQGHAYFKLTDGPLRETLLQAVTAGEEGATFSLSGAGELEITLRTTEGEGDPVLSVRAEQSGEADSRELALSRLAADALEEISRHLCGMAENAAAAATEEVDNDHYNIAAASNRLRVSMAWLKSVIPCTYYSYDEIDGRKRIKEYFWSKELIAILHQLRHKKPTPQDVEFIAAHCCEGDVTWSKEIIARLKSYNRPDPPPKEQGAARGQQRPVKNPTPAGGNDREKGRRQERSPGRPH